MKLLGIFVVLAGSLLATGGAKAVTYDFSNQADPSGPFSLGCSVGGPLNAGCQVTYNNAGLGIRGNPDIDPGNIDSFPWYSFETLVIDFGQQAFMLESFELGHFDPAVDDYEFSLNGGAFSSVTNINPNFVGALVTSFALRASSTLHEFFTPDSFTLKSFTGVAAVPVPAAMPLLAAALAALGLVGWRKKPAISA